MELGTLPEMVLSGSRTEDKTQSCLAAMVEALDGHLAYGECSQARGLVCPDWPCLQVVEIWVRLYFLLVRSWEPQEPCDVPVFCLHLSELSADSRRCEGSK